MVSNIDQYKATNQTEIRFRPGQSILSADAKTAIDQLAEPLKGQRGYIVEVQGFSVRQGTGRDRDLAQDGRLGRSLPG